MWLGRRQLHAHQGGKNSAEGEEHESSGEVATAYDFVVDRRQCSDKPGRRCPEPIEPPFQLGVIELGVEAARPVLWPVHFSANM